MEKRMLFVCTLASAQMIFGIPIMEHLRSNLTLTINDSTTNESDKANYFYEMPSEVNFVSSMGVVSEDDERISRDWPIPEFLSNLLPSSSFFSFSQADEERTQVAPNNSSSSPGMLSRLLSNIIIRPSPFRLQFYNSDLEDGSSSNDDNSTVPNVVFGSPLCLGLCVPIQSVSNPEARVPILKSNKGYLQCVVNETMSYSMKSGFTLKLVEDDEANDPAGSYVCMAGINDSYQLAEYSVIRSYENSTYEYNWDENGGVIFDDNLGRNENVCDPNPCGANSVCEAITNQRTGDPFTCRCEEGFKGKPPRCRSNSLCNPSPCGPNSVCKEDPVRNYPKCACKPTYIGRPPNCQPECNIDDDCHPSFSCHNNTCQNPCLRACSLDAVCTVQNHKARCSCPVGTAGDPSNGGRCHKIRLPSLQFFPFFGLRPRPRPPRPPVSLQQNGPGTGPQQIFPGDSLLSAAMDLFSGSGEVEEYASAEVRNPCEPWPCGPYSQCTPVGEFAHCKCNVGYVGLPPNCRPECSNDKDCSSTHTCVENNCKNPCNSGRGKVRCGANAQCRGRNHQAECVCPSGYRGDPLIRCTPSDSGEASGESNSQETNGMWGSSHRPPPSGSGSTESSEESNPQGQQGGNQKPSRPSQRPVQNQRPPPRPSNPQQGGRPINGGNNGGNGGGGQSCANFCGKNADCVQRNNTVTCRCKPGFTGPGSDPYTECHQSRNPCHKCGPNSVCRVMGNGSPVCECQPGKLGTPPNCRDNVCRHNQDCPADQACHRRTCIDPCSRARCGQYSSCKAINHFAVCACPHDPDKDPLEDGGCPPPPNSSGRQKNPGFFPPTRFFI